MWWRRPSDEKVNRQVSALCREKRIPVNAVDMQEECTFIFPALIKEKEIVVGISTGGSSPTIAQYLKEIFKKAHSQGLWRAFPAAEGLQGDGEGPGGFPIPAKGDLPGHGGRGNPPGRNINRGRGKRADREEAGRRSRKKNQ